MKFPCSMLVAMALCLPTVARAADSVEYNRDIRPILAENCYACHGPDSASREADLRLDRRDALVEEEILVPGKPDESELIVRVMSTSPRTIMPPPKSHKTLSAEQKELLTRWVAAGAEYQPHWSLIAPVRPPLPEVKNRNWPRGAIDHFILARLESMGLEPAPEADRRTLARRVYLDTIGLPPPPEEVERFVADTADDAYEKLVDRLMESPHWGEHRGRYWLDAARYADTHGIHFDNFREMYSYRDWVFGALNANMPFDQFTVEQLAGDLLPNATLEQRIASGFNRCNITTNEGGVIAEEVLVLYTRDRTETVSQVWLGLTAGCAVCHDHKFDPISQKEFYQMAAFFNNTTQGAMDGNVSDTPPIIVVPPVDDRPRYAALETELAEVRGQIDGRKTAARSDFDTWLKKPDADLFAALAPTEGLHLHAALDEGKGKTLGATLDGAPADIELGNDALWEAGHVAEKAIKLKAENTGTLSAAGDFEKDQAFSFGAWVRLPSASINGAIVARMDDQNEFRGWDLWVEGGKFAVHIIHAWDKNALKVVANQPVKPNVWHHVLIAYDGSAKASGIKVYVDGKPQPTRTAADSLTETIRTEVPLRLGGRHASSRFDEVQINDLRIYRRELKPDEAAQLVEGTRMSHLLHKPADARSQAETDELYAAWLGHGDATSKQLRSRLGELEGEHAEIRKRSTIAHVTQERDGPAKAHVLFRGEYDQRRDEVSAATFECLPPMPDDLPRNRLGFAQWLLRPEHPLTTRVTVNRFWQELFGQALVPTAGDFGTTGEMPSHPELLDWLAVEFRESGWDVKRFFKLMLTSAAYRQAAVTTPEKLERDRSNALLSRGPRFRVDAEMVRDYALAASGLLAPKIGGPSAKPYQPDGVWEAVAMIGSNTRDYRRDAGEALYRRSVYTFWKRAAPPASMEIFNGPSRETCTVKRERTNTPLQALVTLNDPQFIEAARHLAQRALREGGEGAESRIDFVARRLLARPLLDEERKIVLGSLERLTAHYGADAEAAKLLIAVGESKADETIDAAELAAWTMLVNQLMNLDEALCK